MKTRISRWVEELYIAFIHFCHVLLMTSFPSPLLTHFSFFPVPSLLLPFSLFVFHFSPSFVPSSSLILPSSVLFLFLSSSSTYQERLSLHDPWNIALSKTEYSLIIIQEYIWTKCHLCRQDVWYLASFTCKLRRKFIFHSQVLSKEWRISVILIIAMIIIIRLRIVILMINVMVIGRLTFRISSVLAFYPFHRSPKMLYFVIIMVIMMRLLVLILLIKIVLLVLLQRAKYMHGNDS